MKEIYTVPELEIVTFVPVEQLASGYLEGYASAIGGNATRSGGLSEEINIPVPGDEGNP